MEWAGLTAALSLGVLTAVVPPFFYQLERCIQNPFVTLLVSLLLYEGLVPCGNVQVTALRHSHVTLWKLSAHTVYTVHLQDTHAFSEQQRVTKHQGSCGHLRDSRSGNQVLPEALYCVYCL